MSIFVEYLTLEQMISRTLIRIKAFKELYSRITTGSTDTKAAESELMQSFVQTQRLWGLMALLPSALAMVAEDKIITQNRKFNPDKGVIEQNSKFASNALSAITRADSVFVNWCNNQGISWMDFETSLKAIYSGMVSKEYFQDYLSIENPSREDAVKLFRHIYSEELSGNEVLEDALENSNIWWTEDLEYVLNKILDRLPSVAASGHVEIPQIFDDKQDEEFAKKLVGVVLVNFDDLAETISSYMTNWEVGRVVQSDILIVAMGIAEAQTFSSIPVKVTINEYVELSKNFSTPKSYSFVNGLLNKILKEMLADGRIQKDPRGMIGGLY